MATCSGVAPNAISRLPATPLVKIAALPALRPSPTPSSSSCAGRSAAGSARRRRSRRAARRHRWAAGARRPGSRRARAGSVRRRSRSASRRRAGRVRDPVGRAPRQQPSRDRQRAVGERYPPGPPSGPSPLAVSRATIPARRERDGPVSAHRDVLDRIAGPGETHLAAVERADAVVPRDERDPRSVGLERTQLPVVLVVEIGDAQLPRDGRPARARGEDVRLEAALGPARRQHLEHARAVGLDQRRAARAGDGLAAERDGPRLTGRAPRERAPRRRRANGAT